MSGLRTALVSLVSLLCFLTPADAQQREITGRVTAADTRAPIAGATVTVAGTRAGALTDANGTFRIEVPSGDVILQVRSVGYETRDVTVPAGQNSASIELAVDVLRLDELVVTGRATSVSRRNLANAVATVSAEEVERVPAESIEKTLQGKIAGAIIDTNSGAPGGGVQVRLRGVTTINAGSDPLYVVDGVVISNAAIPSNANAVTGAAGGSNPSLDQDAVVNRAVDLNPNDIETIEVLKGPSAAAIYGAKAANGVILITTKRGRPGAARFNLTQRFGYFDLSNKLGFRRFETVDEAVSAFGEGAREFFGANGRPRGTFDHEELLAGRNDLSTETTFSVSGGTEATRYFASGLWKQDEGIIANTGFDKQGVRLNLDQRLGERVDLSLNTNFLHTLARRGLTNNDNSGTSFYMVFPFTPNFVDLRERGDGSFPDNPFERSNPLQTAALMQNDEDVYRVISAANLTFDVLRRSNHSLQITATGGVDYFAQDNELIFPPELQFEPNDDGLPGTSLLSQSDNLKLNLSANLIFNYAPALSNWQSTTSTGIQFDDDDLNVARVVSRNLTAGKTNIDAGTEINVLEFRERVKDMGVYLQEELLMLDERLLLSAGVRADRSSANGDSDKMFLYPKAAASYRFTELGNTLNEIKVRAAYGQSGNRPLFGDKFTPLTGNRNIEGLPGIAVVGELGDLDLEPERQREIEGGFDAVLFGARANLTVTGFQKNITNLLLQRELAPSSGFTLQTFNGGELRVRGLEVGLDANPIRTDRLNWFTNATFYFDRSDVVQLPVPSFRTGGFGTALGAYEIAEGESVTQIVAQVAEGDSTVVRKVGDANPDFRVGLSNELTLGRFTLFGLGEWSQGGTVVNLTKLLFDFGQNTHDYDTDPQYVDHIGPIEVDDTLTLGERRVRGFGVETRPYIEDATYFKLRELTLSYAVPETVVGAAFGGAIRSARLSLSGRNLLTFTDYSGLDPEVSNFGNQAIARNIDVAPFPPSRSFWLSFDVTF
jgi:TonB-linked SusC/RagA family outer membrane protein